MQNEDKLRGAHIPPLGIDAQIQISWSQLVQDTKRGTPTLSLSPLLKGMFNKVISTVNIKVVGILKMNGGGSAIKIFDI